MYKDAFCTQAVEFRATAVPWYGCTYALVYALERKSVALCCTVSIFYIRILREKRAHALFSRVRERERI